MQKIDNSADL